MRVICRTEARQREQAVRRGRIGKPLPFRSSQVITRAASASPEETPTPFNKAKASLNRLQNAMCLCSSPVSVEAKAGTNKSQVWNHRQERGRGEITWWVERDDRLQQRLQLSLQTDEADVASLFQSHQRLDTPAHVHSSLQSLFLPKATSKLDSIHAFWNKLNTFMDYVTKCLGF